MKIIKTQIEGLSGPVVYSFEDFKGVVEELKNSFLENGEVGDLMEISIDEMEEDEFNDLPDFEGY